MRTFLMLAVLLVGCSRQDVYNFDLVNRTSNKIYNITIQFGKFEMGPIRMRPSKGRIGHHNIPVSIPEKAEVRWETRKVESKGKEKVVVHRKIIPVKVRVEPGKKIEEFKFEIQEDGEVTLTIMYRQKKKSEKF